MLCGHDLTKFHDTWCQGNCFNLKTSQDSNRLRTAIGEALEMASRPDVQNYDIGAMVP